MTELPESGRDPLEWEDPLRYLIREIENFPAPVIAMIEGTVWGGACEAAFSCDLIVAAPNVTFAVTPAKLGVPYNVSGMVTFLNAASLRIIKEMAFTAQPMGAERAERLGMINYVVPTDELEAYTVKLARQMLANAPLSISVMKEQLQNPGRRPPHVAPGIRARPGTSPRRLQQRRLPGRHQGLQGEAEARLYRKIEANAAVDRLSVLEHHDCFRT